MAFALALSVIACTGVAVVILARMIYGMANHRVLPPVLGNVSTLSPPPSSPAVVGVTLLAADLGLPALHLAGERLQRRRSRSPALLYAAFYILTALAAITYYWRRIFSNVMDAVNLGRAPARCRRVPRLDPGQVAAVRAPHRSSGRWSRSSASAWSSCSSRAWCCGRSSSTSGGRPRVRYADLVCQKPALPCVTAGTTSYSSRFSWGLFAPSNRFFQVPHCNGMGYRDPTAKAADAHGQGRRRLGRRLH